MRHAVSLFILLLIATVAFGGEPAADNQKIVQELERTQARFLKSVEGLSEAQWNFKAAPDKWSVAQCAEHIAASEPFIRGMVGGVLAKDVTAEMIKEGTNKDEMVAKGIVDRSTKFKAPEPLQPTNRFGSPQAAVESYKKERAETIQLATSGGDLRTHADKHFAFGALDAYGWLLFLSGHSERHTLQIEEVKAHPDFPR
jgi:hypothetical protein